MRKRTPTWMREQFVMDDLLDLLPKKATREQVLWVQTQVFLALIENGADPQMVARVFDNDDIGVAA